jgi:hypothetical protein
MRRIVSVLSIVGLLLVWSGTPAQEHQAAPATLPAKIMETLTRKFPGAQITTWTRERERGTVLYDIEFTKGGRKLEADILEGGTLHNWEQAVAAAELPTAVRRTAEKLYPGCTVKEAMRKMVVKKGKDVPEGYELTLTTRDKKSVEVTTTPNGTVLEAPGANKK